MNKEAIKAVETSVHQALHLISRIANRHHGIKQASIIILVREFALRRIVNATASLAVKADARKKINHIIKSAGKQALGMPIKAQNERFGVMGLQNPTDELLEAQKIAQLERLCRSKTGKHILE